MDFDSILFEDDDIEMKSLEDNLNKSEPEASVPFLKKENEKNPAEEYLLKQLNCVENQIDQTRANIEVIESVTDKILNSLAKQAAYREYISSDSDSDLYSNIGHPVFKKKKNKFYQKQKVLEINDTCQRVIDDKWIIGAVLESKTSCVLRDPTMYVHVKDREEDHHGVSVIWTLVHDTYWYPTEEIEGRETVVATAVLDLPSFEDSGYVEVQGMIICEFDEKLFQTPVSTIRLDVQETLGGNCAVDLDDENEAQFSILALKAISVDRVVLLPVQPESNIGKRLMNFLEKYDFKEVCKVCVAMNAGSLQYCILEVLPADEADVRILISARTEVQLSMVVQLLRKDFPELLDVEKQQALDEAAEALLSELRLYLTGCDKAELQRARITTDLLIP